MSVRAESWAWSIEGLSAYEKLVLLLLCRLSSDVTRECWPSKEGITELVGCSKRKVDMCIAVLTERELIQVIHRRSESMDLTNVYRVLVSES